MNRLHLWSVLFASLALAACSGSSGGKDAGTDNPVVADVIEDAALPDAGDPGIAPDEAPADLPDVAEEDLAGDATTEPGELPPYEDGATAFIATSADQLASGPMATGTLGDIVLKNRFVRFVVRNQEQSLYNPYPGSLVDADRVRADGVAGNEQFFELFPMIGFGRVFKPSKMEIVDDGQFTGTAIVRFSGTDAGISLIDSILQTTSAGLEATVEYILGPDAHNIEVVTRVKNVGGLVDPVVVGQVLVLGKRLVKFHDVCGANTSCLSTHAVRWLAGSLGDVSYALTVPGPGGLQMLLNVEDIMVLQSGSYSLAVGEETTVRQFLVVGDGTIDDATLKARELRDEPAGAPVAVDVALSESESALSTAFVKVHEVGAGDNEGWVAGTTPGPDGKAIVHLLPGDYDVSVSLPGAPDATVPAVHVSETGADPILLTANPAGWMRVRVKDPQGNPVTAALTLQSGHGAALGASTFGYRAVENGDRAFPIDPGEYTANLSHGLVWTLDRKDVTVEAGKVVEVDAVIEPAIDTTGYRMVNTHEHTEWSADSQTTVEDRVWNALANGVDVMVATDHDHFGTRQPTIEALGLKDQVRSVTGCEVSPMWGHSTAAGCRKPPAYETYYSVDFVVYDDTGTMTRLSTAAEIHKQARDEFDCAFLGVNHPYRSEGTFNLYKIDGESDPALAEPALDLHLVDAMEVYNKSDDIDSIQSSNLPAWFNLLNRGYSIAAIGGSDEHDYAGTYGSPRNMVPTDAGLNDADLEDKVFGALKAWRSLMLGGPVILLTVDGATLGDTVTATDGTVEVRVQVLAPDWMQLNLAKVFVNGELVREITVLPGPQLVRADETFELSLLTDAHIVAVAGSNNSAHRMQPVSFRVPFSVTNPVFVDVGGDGYTPIYKDGAPWD